MKRLRCSSDWSLRIHSWKSDSGNDNTIYMFSPALTDTKQTQIYPQPLKPLQQHIILIHRNEFELCTTFVACIMAKRISFLFKHPVVRCHFPWYDDGINLSRKFKPNVGPRQQIYTNNDGKALTSVCQQAVAQRQRELNASSHGSTSSTTATVVNPVVDKGGR